ncbi:hypothetical protein [Planococcus alpniumensis]|uniref:hypothetical protein n=1 Tax=Planococcus alpniumensis TaxID=2708345 RepID=UPI001B8D7783|nr:hypothetical protein [Planococcus sp. MSAK28401]
MKNFFSLLVFFSALFVSFLTVSAADLSTYDQLTEEEKEYLLESNFTEEIINQSEVEFVRELIEEGANLLTHGEDIYSIQDNTTAKPGEFTTLGVISSSKLKLSLSAYEVTSDRTGSSKFRLYGTYKWLSKPVNTFTDAISLGWSSSSITYPTSGGNVFGYSQRNYETSAGSRFQRSYTFTPITSTYGLGNRFNLRQGASVYDGNINVHIYSKTKSGAFNTVLSYGHARATVNPSFNASKGFLSVTPGLSVDTAQYAKEVRY